MPPRIIDSSRRKEARKLWELDINKHQHWFQAMADSCNTGLPFEEFLERNFLLVGVYDNRQELVGGYMFEQLSEDCANVHVAVRDRNAVDEMIRSGIAVKEWLKEQGITQIVAWSVRQNFPMIRLAKRLGFTRTGLSRVEGQYHGRALEWHQFLMSHQQI